MLRNYYLEKREGNVNNRIKLRFFGNEEKRFFFQKRRRVG